MDNDKYFNEILKILFGIEGGYVNHTLDKGGATNFGITQDTMNSWRKRNRLPSGSVKTDLTKQEAREIYYNMFWKESGAHKYTDPRDAMILFDMAVNSGPSEAIRVFKNSNENFYKMLENRKKYYENIIFNQPSQGVFKEGWDNRLKFLENSANKMVESGFYIPPYYNEITPFDEGYEGPLTSRTNADNKMALRNKYQYNLNKAKSLQINTQTKDVSNLSKSPSKPLDFDEWLDELKRKRRKGL